MHDTDKEVLDAVNARAEQLQSASQIITKEVPLKQELDKAFVLERLRRNRVNDADLFCNLSRGKYVYVEEWGRWLYWAGHHWDVDMISKRALADVERVCAAYQNAYAESGEDEGTPLHKLLKKVHPVKEYF